MSFQGALGAGRPILALFQPFWTSRAPKDAKFHRESNGKGPEARNRPKTNQKSKKKKKDSEFSPGPHPTPHHPRARPPPFRGPAPVVTET